MTEIDEIFADISVLMDYCLVYRDGQDCTDLVFDEIHKEGGSIVASEEGYTKLNKMMSNRQRLFTYLVDKCSEYLKDSDLTESDYTRDILNYSNINDEMDFEVDESFLPDIEMLRDFFEDTGLKTFRNELNSIVRRGSVKRRQLHQRFFADDALFSKGGQSATMLRITISGLVDYQTQEVSLVDAAFWCQQEGSQILISHGSGPHEQVAELLKAIENIASGPVSAYSPKEIAEKI